VRDSQTQAKLNPQTPSSGASRHLLPVGEGSKASSTASRSPLTQNPSPPGRGAAVRDLQTQARLNPRTPSSGAAAPPSPGGRREQSQQHRQPKPGDSEPLSPRERGRGEGLAASSHAQPSNTLIRRFAPPSPGGGREQSQQHRQPKPVDSEPLSPRERGRGEGLAASSQAQPSDTLIRRFAPPFPGGRREQSQQHRQPKPGDSEPLSPRERGRGEGLAGSSQAQSSNTLIRRFAPPSPGGRRRRTVTRCSGSDPRCRPACRVWRRRNRCRPSVSNRHDPVRRTRRLPSGVP